MQSFFDLCLKVSDVNEHRIIILEYSLNTIIKDRNGTKCPGKVPFLFLRKGAQAPTNYLQEGINYGLYQTGQ